MVALITFPFFGILLLLLSRTPLSHGSGILGGMKSLAVVHPDNPELEEGDTLVLNCTLTKHYNGPFNASDIYFSYSNIQNYTYPYVQVLSNITVEFRLPNISIDRPGLYLCCLPGIYLGLDNAQSVFVGRRPLTPHLNGCIVYNWERMECTWSPSREEQDVHTHGHLSFSQTLFYQDTSDDDNWKTCPQNASEKCTWPASQFRMGAKYCIQINATNTLKHIVASNVTCVSIQEEIVKPNPPENLEPSYASDYDGHMTLSWNPPASSYVYETPLHYELNIQNQWEDQVNYVTNATSMRLSVVPATNYTVEISVRPSRFGFASDKVVKRFETPATVPCKNPYTHTNAFSVVRDSGEKKEVLLYWQPITPRDSCGSNLSYEVHARQSHGNTYNADIWRSVIPVVRLDNGAEVMLNSEEDEVMIQSKNSVGVATHLPHTVIRVPPSASKGNASNYRLVVEGKNNSVMVHWFATGPEEDVTGYSLFYCQRQSSTRFCKTPIQWQNLNGAESEYNLTLSEDYLKFQVGLAVNSLSDLTTGIMWADRLYSQTAIPEVPHIVDVSVPYLVSHGEIDISWTPAKCNNEECAYIHTFVIFYCLADHQDNCHGENQSVRIAAWKSSTYLLTNLEHGSKYRIWMTSVSRAGSSGPSEPMFVETTKSWVTAGAVAGIIVAILCLGTIAIAGLYIILRCLHKYRKELVTGLPVIMPPSHRAPIASTSSEAPMLGTKFDYYRQESVSSGDSGRYSLTPVSPATLPLLSKLTDANENLDGFMPRNVSALEDTKTGDDNDSTRDCVLSYTIVSNDAPDRGESKSVVTLLNAKKGDVANPNVVSNGNTTGHSKHSLPEQVELFGMVSSNPEESDVNYCTSFSFARPSTGNNNTSGNSAADIGYTKVENLQPLYDLVDMAQNADVANERSQDSDVLQFDSSEDDAPVKQPDLVYTIDQLLATLSADPPLMNDLQINDCVTGIKNNEPQQPPPPPTGDGDTPFRGYMKIGNADFPSLACDDAEWMASKPDFPQQLPLSSWGYVDHAMFGVDSVA